MVAGRFAVVSGLYLLLIMICVCVCVCEIVITEVTRGDACSRRRERPASGAGD
jgi:hypothetical protein